MASLVLFIPNIVSVIIFLIFWQKINCGVEGNIVRMVLDTMIYIAIVS